MPKRTEDTDGTADTGAAVTTDGEEFPDIAELPYEAARDELIGIVAQLEGGQARPRGEHASVAARRGPGGALQHLARRGRGDADRRGRRLARRPAGRARPRYGWTGFRASAKAASSSKVPVPVMRVVSPSADACFDTGFLDLGGALVRQPRPAGRVELACLARPVGLRLDPAPGGTLRLLQGDVVPGRRLVARVPGHQPVGAADVAHAGGLPPVGQPHGPRRSPSPLSLATSTDAAATSTGGWEMVLTRGTRAMSSATSPPTTSRDLTMLETVPEA